MTIRTLSIAAALTLAISGAALAQTPAGGGSAEGNMNNPGSVKSSSDKAMEGRGGTMGSGSMGAAPGASGGPSTGTPGAAGTGTSGGGGNAATGSGAAPSGK